MRLIGRISNETGARTFGDYLTSVEIPNQVEADSDGSWLVWILSEDQIEAGNAALARYLDDPHNPKYRGASIKAEAVREREKKELVEFKKRIRTADSLWPSSGVGPLTIVLIGLSVIVTCLIQLDPKNFTFFISLYRANSGLFLVEVHHGEAWRLITPIFIHFGVMHILFNMMWLLDLGGMIEARQGTFKLLLLVLVIGVVSNVAQYLNSGPSFGGMSGVNYGLLGYVWMRGKFDPASGLRLDPRDIMLSIIFFFLCLIGLIPHVANTVHAVGLIMGMIWGAIPPIAKKILKV